MTAILTQILVSLVASGLSALSGYLIAHHVITAAQGDTLTSDLMAHVLLVLPWLGGLALGLWSRYKNRVQFLTALAMPVGATENDVNAKIASGAATPTLLTPPATIPGVPIPKGP